MLSYASNAQVQTTYLEEWYVSDGSQAEASDRVVCIPDIDGNTYVTGSTLNQYGKQDLLLTKYNATGGEIWSETFNLADTNSSVVIGDIIMNFDDDLYLTGTVYNGTTQDYDVLTVKYDSSGVFKWHKLYDGAGSIYDAGVDVMYDNSNRIFVTGSTTNATGHQDFLTLCYSTGGTQLWAKTYDGYGLTDISARIDNFTFFGQVKITGFSQKTASSWVVTQITYNSSTGNIVGSPTQSTEVFIDEIRDVTMDDDFNIYFAGISDDQGNGKDFMIVKVNFSMAVAWTKYYDGADHLDDEAQGIIVDNNTGRVYVTGYTKTSTQGKNFVVLKYAGDGTLQWSKIYNGAANGDDEALDIKVDNTGQIVATGYSTENNNQDYLTLILDSNGNEVWSASFNGLDNQDDKGRNLLLDGNGNITLVGHTGTKGGKSTYTTVRYNKKDLFIPPDSEATSTAINYEENKGQLIKTNGSAVSEIKFSCTSQSPALYFQHDQVSFVLAHVDTSSTTQDTMHRVDMTFNKSKGNERIYGLSERDDYHNYYLGHIPTGRENVRLYDRLIQTDVFEKIDFQYFSNGGGVKYYFICEPGANPKDIELVFDGHESLSVNGNGDLVIKTSLEDIVLPQPSVSQFTATGTETPLGWTPTYSVVNDTVSLSYGAYDVGKYLVFKVKEDVPTVPSTTNFWSTYYGGSSFFDVINNFATAPNGEVYACGMTRSADFPILNSLQTFNFNGGGYDAFVLKFDALGVRDWSTFYGGGIDFNGNFFGVDAASDLVVDNLDNVYTVGYTYSSNFPLEQNGPAYFNSVPPINTSGNRGFIFKLLSDGSREWATYFGEINSGSEIISAVEIGDNNHLIVAGFIEPPVEYLSFPFTAVGEAHTQAKGSNFIAEFDVSNQISWATLFSSTATENNQISDIEVKDNEVFITGKVSGTNPAGFELRNLGNVTTQQTHGGGDSDAFIAKFTNTRKLYWSSFFGGNDHDAGSSIINDGMDIYVAGNTNSSSASFPLKMPNQTPNIYDDVLNGPSDLFIAKFSDIGDQIWTSYFGGNGFDEQIEIGSSFELRSGGESMDIDDCLNIYITGVTSSSDLNVNTRPLVPESMYFSDINQGNNTSSRDAFILVVNPGLEQQYLSYWGGWNGDSAYGLQANGSEYIVFGGESSSAEEDGRIPLNKIVQDSYFQPDIMGIPDGFISLLPLPQFMDCYVDVSPVFKTLPELKIFPNPTNGLTNLSIENTQIENVFFDINLFNSIGGNVLNKQNVMFFQSGTVELNLKHLPSGVYILNLSNEQYAFTFKLIKS